MGPYPIGTKVTYRGSHTWRHGEEYVITEHKIPTDYAHIKIALEVNELTLEYLTEHYADGVAYTLFPEGVNPLKFGDRDEGMYCVRRESLIPVDISE